MAAAAVDTVYAPPATVFLQALQVQIPVAPLCTVLLPQKEQSYLACCWTSIFLVCLLKDEPYLTPNLPVIPTFLVLLVLGVSKGATRRGNVILEKAEAWIVDSWKMEEASGMDGSRVLGFTRLHRMANFTRHIAICWI